ncbi:putative zinc transporter msc2 [Neofusicoccum ribis]|uniref:Zinc transporter n=1 Tax=Neofusicoccum ribis TaxID=45134 RepID=A0ABR3SQT5_9PEZI
MASTSATYALPLDSSVRIHPQHGRGHTHHYSNSLLPDRSPTWSPSHNGAALKKAHSHGSLHAPAPAPLQPSAQSSSALLPVPDSFNTTGFGAMKGRPKPRPRGESNLGRPASAGSIETTSGYGFPPVATHAEDAAPANKLLEIVTGTLVPLPYILASLAFPAHPQTPIPDTPSDSAFDRLRASVSEEESPTGLVQAPQRSPLFEACILASGTLLFTALLAKLRPNAQALDRRKAKFAGKGESIAALRRVQQIAATALSAGLPFYAAAQLGGVRAGVVLLTAIACGLCGTNAALRPFLAVRRMVQEKKLLCAYLGLGLICDMTGFSASMGAWQFLTGYLALATSIFVLPPPLPITVHTTPPPAQANGMVGGLSPLIESPDKVPVINASAPITASPLVLSKDDVTTTFVSGALVGIFTNTSLNLAFMAVQFFYGFVTGSLGLLTDSIHMFFDCAGLAVGLIAAVMSKWPSNARFPYGYGKVDTLSGFANGIFLILVSFEIILDAFERIWEGHELRRLDELLIVSVLGLVVNIVGLTAMGHAHAHAHGGHDHHHHGDENMQGIFLHILADALGSVAVIISTLLTKWNGWNGWDPLASSIIALLIFFSALPLTLGAGMRLLLCNNQQTEDALKDVLRDLNSIRGVTLAPPTREPMAIPMIMQTDMIADTDMTTATATATAIATGTIMITIITTLTRMTMAIPTATAMVTTTATAMTMVMITATITVTITITITIMRSRRFWVLFT